MSHKRIDNNQREIVDALRKCGVSVQSLASVGKGCPDLLVCNPHKGLFLLEVKDGSKPPSERRLTLDEQRWHYEWPWPVYIVESADEALSVIGCKG